MSLNDDGFVVHHGTIETSGVGNAGIRSTDVNLITTKSTASRIKVGNLYTMKCKLIASNDAKPDYLHVDDSTCVNHGPMAEVSENFLNTTIDKVSFTTRGMVMAIKTMPPTLPGASDGCMITLQSTDIDPTSQRPVMWMTKHHLERMPTLQSAKSMWQIGVIVYVSGDITGYDVESSMWISKVFFASCMLNVTMIKLVLTQVNVMQSCRGRLRNHKVRYGLSPIPEEGIKDVIGKQEIGVCNKRTSRQAFTSVVRVGGPQDVFPDDVSSRKKQKGCGDDTM
ncbi:uncharacterized protein MELLADRAFT_58310 [Melampsora larici-populina 98AG31]|uniref:Uncharacterized protein n=1 Tax=Melampsora larici-populina (strain 98AG31 / pathotype 3-4-7) TaxID=747676 RepID=F4R324_MELLP|nr:uncharacterized protein MELLADRAFT_58310 [Melampsora larici-populina 98AG31]EGG13244.1 hypothetical protein MELLADRAFT_58310 [Melampsora larici-populina 98AG31]